MLHVLHDWRGRFHSLFLSLCGRCVVYVDAVFVDVCECGVVSVVSLCGVVSVVWCVVFMVVV